MYDVCGSCTTAASDSCSDPKASCTGVNCKCNSSVILGTMIIMAWATIMLERVAIWLEGDVCGSCTAKAYDSCSDPNASCNEATCECNADYYDDDDISNNNAGTCTIRKYQFNLMVLSVKVVPQQHPIPVVILMPHEMVVPVSVMLGTMMMMMSATIMLERIHYIGTNLTWWWC